MITAAAKADKQSCSLLRDVDMSVYSADGPTSSDSKAKPKLVWETHKLIKCPLHSLSLEPTCSQFKLLIVSADLACFSKSKGAGAEHCLGIEGLANVCWKGEG